MSAYLVTREGQELGSFEAIQIQDGLKTGFFHATDWGWREGMSGWQALPEIVGPTAAPQARALASPTSAPIKQPTGLKPDSLNPFAAPTANVRAGAVGAVPYPVIAELTGTKPWVRLISVLMWILCILFIGVVLAILLFQSVFANAMAQSGSNMGWGVVVGTAFFYGVTAMLIVYPTMKLSNYASNISRLAESQSFTHLTKALGEQRRFWKFYGIIILIYLCLAALFILLMVLTAGASTSIVHPR